MEQVETEMLHIMSMDPGAYVGYSDFIHMWYVHTNLMEGEDGFSSSIPTHANTPNGAVHMCFEALKNIQTSKESPRASIIKDRLTSDGENTYYRWNGVCFAVVSLPARLASSSGS